MPPAGPLIIGIPPDRSRECTHENDTPRDSSSARHPEAAWRLEAARRAGSGERPVRSPEARHQRAKTTQKETVMTQLDTMIERDLATSAGTVDMKLEVVVIPVSDVDRAKRFYGDLGWRLDADFVVGDAFRGVQFTPPGSPCSIQFGSGGTSAVPGSAGGHYLVVSDIQSAHAELVKRGVDVSEVFHRDGPGEPALSGPDPA